jgi:hypothetical protein
MFFGSRKDSLRQNVGCPLFVPAGQSLGASPDAAERKVFVSAVYVFKRRTGSFEASKVDAQETAGCVRSWL